MAGFMANSPVEYWHRSVQVAVADAAASSTAVVWRPYNVSVFSVLTSSYE